MKVSAMPQCPSGTRNTGDGGAKGYCIVKIQIEGKVAQTSFVPNQATPPIQALAEPVAPREIKDGSNTTVRRNRFRWATP